MTTMAANFKVAWLITKMGLLTHPESGIQVGTRLHKSLRIRMTITAEFNMLTLAWRHKEAGVQHFKSLLYIATPKNQAKKLEDDLR